MSETHLAQGLSLQYLTKHLRLTIVLLIIKLELQRETTEFSYRSILSVLTYSFFPVGVRESNQAIQINVNAVFQIKTRIAIFNR